MALEIRAWNRDLGERTDEFCRLLQAQIASQLPTGTRENFYVALEHDSISLRRIAKVTPLKNRMLVIFEPKSVHPRQHTRRIRRKYGTVVITSEDHRLGEAEIAWDYGVLPNGHEIQALVDRNRSKVEHREFAVGLINENKFSMNRDEAYTQRQRIISRMSKSNMEIAVAGANWDKGILWYLAKQAHAAIVQIQAGYVPALTHIRLPFRRSTLKRIRLLGRVPTQVGFLSRCAYALVIENEPTYVTEKLFNALLGGALPLYVGPGLERFGIPESVAKNVKRPLLNGIRQSLEMPLEHKQRWAREIEKWLLTPETQDRWGLEPSANRLAGIIFSFVSPN